MTKGMGPCSWWGGKGTLTWWSSFIKFYKEAQPDFDV